MGRRWDGTRPTLAERSADAGGAAPEVDPVRGRPLGPEGDVRGQDPWDEGPGDGVPVTLTVEQIGGESVHRGARAVAVFAWVPWTDGRYRAVVAFAGEWTASAVHLRWRDDTAGLRDVWVWATGVRRREPEGRHAGP